MRGMGRRLYWTCTLSDCFAAHFGKGLCSKHYMRLRTTGSLHLRESPYASLIQKASASHPTLVIPRDDIENLAKHFGVSFKSAYAALWRAGFRTKASKPPKQAKPPQPSFEDAFWSKVDRTGDCWIWQSSRFATGYGRVTYQGKSAYSHRVSWTLTNGEIPNGFHVCHHCDNPPCVRPDHLFLGTPLDNMRDRDRKGRHGRTGKLKQVCKRGHGFDEANTRVDAKGKRTCRACVALRQRLRYQTLKAAAV